MVTVPSQTPGSETITGRTQDFLSALSWKSVIAGTVAAIGIHILLTALGVGAGLAAFSPATDSEAGAHFGLGAAIVWTICALISLAAGGFVAGRFSQSPHGGFTHGILVWSLSLIITVFLLSRGTGMVLGGASKLLGRTLQIGGNVAEAGLSQNNQGADQVASFIEEATHSGQTNASPADTIRAKREIGQAVTRLFTGDKANSVEARMQLKDALVEYGKMKPEDAQKTIDQWSRSYNQLRDEAKATAQKAATGLSRAGLWCFFALLVGLIVTAFAGYFGASYSLHHPELAVSVDTMEFPHDGHRTVFGTRPVERQPERSNP